MTVWLTADHHFFHDNIRAYCNRPFDSMREMNARMEELWNHSIKPGDEVYVLGDFALAGAKYAWDLEQLFKRLHGRKTLIVGSHDRGNLHLPWKQLIRGHVVLDGAALVHDGEEFVRNHKEWRELPVFAGHVHAIWQVRRNILNVGVDTFHFRPWLWEKAVEYQRERYEYWRQHEARFDRP